MHAPLWDLNLFFLSKWIFWIQNQGISSVPPQKSQWLHGHALQKHIQRHVLIESTQLHVKHTETRRVCEVRPGLILYYTNPTNNWHDVSLVYEWIIIKIPGKQQASKYMFTILCFFLSYTGQTRSKEALWFILPKPRFSDPKMMFWFEREKETRKEEKPGSRSKSTASKKQFTLHAGMVDPEAKPIGVAIDWCEIVDIEINRNFAGLLLLGHQYHPTQHFLSILLLNLHRLDT